MLNRQNVLVLGILAVLFIGLWFLVKNDSSSGGQTSAETNLPDEISYNFHVKPILSDKCFACHGPDANKRKGGLRLDEEAVAKSELLENPGKFAIINNSPDESELVKRIFTTDETALMPPADSHLKLTSKEKGILKKWIEQGAQYDKHWAFVTPKKAELPSVKDEAWPENEIDYFILEAIEKQGLSPSEPTSKSKLIRRLSLDLTGLPPNIDELNKFVLENDDFDFEEIVDYYLAKPAFGERMTRDWLDVARYADSHGYQDDSYRTMWP